jgi:hypothetical protein
VNGIPVVLEQVNSPFDPSASRTIFSIWMDPPIFSDGSGPFSSSFLSGNTPGVLNDGSDVFSTSSDDITEIQYAFETVPFKLDPELGFSDINAPLSTYYPNPLDQPTLPDYSTWPNTEEAIDSGENGYCYLASEGPNGERNDPYITPTSEFSERTYNNDVYIFVGEPNPANPNDNGVSSAVQPGMWLIDRFGGKFKILSVSGNEMTLERGHAAYLDRVYKFKTTPTGDPVEVDIPQWPYMRGPVNGVQEELIGEEFAVQRGRWVVVRETLVRNEYPRQSNWPEGDGSRAARLLKQHVMQDSVPTAMLGFNLAGVEDPVVNQSNEVNLRSITVAFWGPEFDPSDLAQLDEDGQLIASGVLLYEDTNGTGSFDGPVSSLATSPVLRDQIVPMQAGSVVWPSAPEGIDLDGDYQYDDLSGDGQVVFTSAQGQTTAGWDGLLDVAWVLRLQPVAWTVPHTDFNPEMLVSPTKMSPVSVADEIAKVSNPFKAPDFWAEVPQTLDMSDLVNQKAGRKALNRIGNFGDDIFVVVRTSEDIGAFEQFRCLVPARLPARTPLAEQIGGLEFSPRAYLSTGSFEKLSPDEGAVQDFYGHDMLEASVPARVVDLTTTLQANPVAAGALITPGGPPSAVLGIDASANRPENLIAAGDTGTVQNNIFTTGSFTLQPEGTEYYGANGWTNNVVGLWLIAKSAAADANDSRIEAYQIIAVNNNNVTLRAGLPAADSKWQIVKDPSFLEQVIVEFYDTGLDGDFDLTQDLLPLNQEDPANSQFSGVSLYRDNDFSLKTATVSSIPRSPTTQAMCSNTSTSLSA